MILKYCVAKTFIQSVSFVAPLNNPPSLQQECVRYQKVWITSSMDCASPSCTQKEHLKLMQVTERGAWSVKIKKKCFKPLQRQIVDKLSVNSYR